MRKFALYSFIISSAVATPAAAQTLSAAGLREESCGVTQTEHSLPAQWEYIEGFTQTLPSDDKWWRQFDDPVLNELMQLAEANNYDLAAAYRRIESAEGILTQTRAGFYPSLSFSGGWQQERSSGLSSKDPARAATDRFFSLGLQMNWEIDVFGRVAAKAKASKASLDATRAEYAGAQISLAANLATAYVSLREAQADLSILKDHLESQEKVVKIAEARSEAGIGNKLEVSQARQVYLQTEARIPSVNARIDAGVNSLALLCGVYPEQIEEKLRKSVPMPILLLAPETGVPNDLLRRRPDILQAEKKLAEAAALAGVAKKDFLPVLSLSASAGTEARRADNLFRDQSFTYTIAPTLSWTLFEGFARRGALAEARANMEEAIDNYNQTVHSAVSEVNTAMANLSYSIQAIQSNLKLLDQTRETFRLSLDLYKRGLTEFQNVTDAQITQLEAESTLIDSKAQSLIYAITLYRALGGGY